MPVLKAKIGGSWVDLPTGGDEVWVGPDAPADSGIELWYDTDAIAPDAITTTPWTAVTLLNGWVNFGSGYQAAQYRKVGDMVQVRGTIKSGTAADGTVLFALPAGHIPPANVQTVQANGAANAHLTMQSSGNCVVTDGAISNSAVNITFQFSVTA